MKKYIVWVLPLLAGCGTFQRSADSGYGSRSPKIISAYSSTESAIADSETNKIAYELGLNPNAMSSEDWELVQQRHKLKALEKSLDSKREKEQYAKVLPWLKNDEEKIELLSIPSIEGRQAWINRRNIWARSRVPVQQMKELIDTQDIAVGMPMEFVRRAWGDPAAVEVSGNPVYKNERWRYNRSIASTDGFRQEKRFVYFEGGRVVGWETE